MNDILANRILDALRKTPHQKANQLARTLGVERADVNKALYGALMGRVVQDRSYKWSVVETASANPPDATSADPVQFLNTELAALCRYYLACLGYDDTGVSTFLTSKFGDTDYIEVDLIPRTTEDFARHDAARRLLGRKRTERGRYGLYFGYPTSISLLKSRRSNWEGLMVEPVFLFPIEQESNTGRLIIDLSFPIINQKPFQAFTNADRDMLMNELVHLEQELGISGESEAFEIDEMAMRLQSIRAEWPWREQIDPNVLDHDRAPIDQIDAPGIYNRAVIIMAEKSPFTQGLEKELRDLGQIPSSQYTSTVLGRWLSNREAVERKEQEQSQPLLEVLPMNSEQREAVSAALTQPVTVITGPPGTGKSQVVTNLLVNAAWSGKRILFASKNNKAVDVVETRVNALGPRPILLRVGGQAYQVRLAEYVLALLGSTTSSSEKEEFADSKAFHQKLLAEHARLIEESKRLVELRNDVDRLEQRAEGARSLLGPDLFARAAELDLNRIKTSVNDLIVAIERADPKSIPTLFRSAWPIIRKRRLADLVSTMARSLWAFGSIGVILPKPPGRDADVLEVRHAADSAHPRLTELAKAAAYHKRLHELKSARSLEEIALDEAALLDRIACHSEVLWKLWLRLQPSKLSPEERQKLGKYTALLKMVIETGEQGQLTGQAYAQYNRMLREISHLLPCWAVTSLSARGRLPFEAGVFDIVVFDEASQCDIASALPLLYRAKSAVIIGDPKQLSHISGLRRGQDQMLLERFELMEKFPHWAYSYQSLFGLSATQVSGEGIVSLVDHHRSHADIINFSNSQFYEEKLRVATKHNRLRTPDPTAPGIRWVDVKGRATRPANGGAVNEPEAKAVVATLRDLVLAKGYEGSLGVVSPFRAQANLVTELVNRDRQLAPALIEREFLSDTVHKFQGDERDVMIFSPVVSTDTPPGALGFLRSNGNLFNVAITRARAQLIVVGDLAACSAAPIDYLSNFAAYTTSLIGNSKDELVGQVSQAGPTYPTVAKPELVSDWEREFYIAAYQAGLRLVPQYQIEKYIVDFLMISDNRKLVIEIDGERYHRNWTGELCRRDQIRNQRLFELGYDVIRFWVYEVRDDLRSCLKRIKEWQDRVADTSQQPHLRSDKGLGT